MTPFKKFLQEAVHLYFSATWDCNAFVKAQQLSDNLLTAINSDDITRDEYRALYHLVNHLINEMRDALKKSGQL